MIFHYGEKVRVYDDCGKNILIEDAYINTQSLLDGDFYILEIKQGDTISAVVAHVSNISRDFGFRVGDKFNLEGHFMQVKSINFSNGRTWSACDPHCCTAPNHVCVETSAKFVLECIQKTKKGLIK